MTTDVFISYARENRETAHQLAEALHSDGLEVWWDRELVGGGDFAAEIERELAEAKVVLVLWSAASVASGFVRDESSRARDRGTLLPLRIEDVALPLGFGSLHTLDLLEWDGDAADPVLQDVVSQLRARLKTALPQGPRKRRLVEVLPGRRHLLTVLGLGGAGLAGAGWWWQSARVRDRHEARDRLEQALQFHFSQPPQWERARSAYLDALHLDHGLARAHYFLGHLYVQLLLDQGASPQESVQAALRRDANEQFRIALQLDARDAGLLDRSQRVIADQQLLLLRQQDETAPVVREGPPAPAAVVAAPASAPSPVASAVTGLADPIRRRPASAVLLAHAQAQARALFDARRDNRLAASALLTLDAALAAEALPVAITETVAALHHASPDEAAQQGMTTTLALLRRASPATWRSNQELLRNDLLPALRGAPAAAWPKAAQEAIAVDEALIRARRPRQRPVVYLQIAEERQRPVARGLQQRLVEAGYVVPDIEVTGLGRAPDQPGLRVQGASDPALARWCLGLLDQVVGAPAASSVLRSAHPATDTFEIWFDAGVCDRVSGCAPKS